MDLKIKIHLHLSKSKRKKLEAVPLDYLPEELLQLFLEVKLHLIHLQQLKIIRKHPLCLDSLVEITQLQVYMVQHKHNKLLNLQQVVWEL